MCGILGLAGPNLPDDATVERMRDLMSLRGPDGSGLWRGRGVAFAHRRLAVIDPTEAAAQPMVLGDGSALVYNGELYNDHEVRLALIREGAAFRTACDTETVLLALRHWGGTGLKRLRGMFALGWFDAKSQSLLLARDPLGIKPLHYSLQQTRSGSRLVFASDVRSILACPGIAPRPDMLAVSRYMTTIRTSLGDRTMFDGIRCLRPGEVLTFNLGAGEPILAHRTIIGVDPATGSTSLRAAVEDSIRRHLVSDVPTCCLLSGGLDSTIIAVEARRHHPDLQTYCAGATPDSDDAGSSTLLSDDFAFAREAAEAIGTRHTEVPVSREAFGERWTEMVATLGMPLSTPNEVAIYEVASRIRADGKIVALTGEGADELFGGYDTALTGAAEFLAGGLSDEATAAFLLDSASWVPRGLKGQVLQPDLWRALESDAALVAAYTDEFAEARAGYNDEPLQAHLRFQRRVNLVGLLSRLDSATMLAGVEGRTPLADVAIASIAEALPMSRKFQAGEDGQSRTKIALREAFADTVPPRIMSRPKASFPLPFQAWMPDQAGELRSGRFIRTVFTDQAIELVASDPARHWRLAWPMVNLALWGRRWWG